VSTSDQTPTGQVRTTTSPRPAGARPAAGQQARTAGASGGGAPAPGTGATRTITPGSRPPGPGARPAAKRAPARKAPPRPGGRPAPGAPRRVRLTVARVDPWSVMKLAFLLSVAIGIATVVAAGVLWTVLDGMGVFTDINDLVAQILGAGTFDINDYVGFGKVLSLGTVLAVVNVVLITALCTLGAFLYNVASNLVGGLHLTLSDD
jgi:hypothetical protein